MNPLELYQTLKTRDHVHIGDLAAGDRIAVQLDDKGQQYDIMKVRAIGKTKYAPGTIAVAAICPGQATFQLRNGDVYLNTLVDIGRQERAGGRSSLAPVQVHDVLAGYGRAHYVEVSGKRVVPISKAEMATLQELVRPIAPEIYKS